MRYCGLGEIEHRVDVDRLFKIRHCMNIDGIVQELPLFPDPIDPRLLVEARAGTEHFEYLRRLSGAAALFVAVDDLEPNRRYALAFKFLPRLCECCGNRMKTDALTAVRLRHNERALSAK